MAETKMKIKKSKTIFTVHCMVNTNRISERRTFGWFAELYDANCAVRYNRCDIHECYYNYAVIEEINQGIFGMAVKEWWWKWDKKQQRYLSINKPKKFKQLTNFGMG